VEGRGGAPAPADAAALARWRVFPPLAIGTVMATLDISVVNIALPTLARAFRVPLTTIEWVVLSYVVTITGLLLTLGRLADRVGRRRVYGAGLVVFTIASALCAAAPGANMLVAARALQGLGAAMMTANSAAILISSFPVAERGRALGAFGAMVGVGLALGPPIGGMLVHFSWRWIFLLNLPLGLLALVQLRARVPADPPSRGVAGMTPDLPGAALWCAALVLVMLGLSRGPQSGWRAPSVWLVFLAAAVALVAFFARERRTADPLLPVRILRGALGRAVLVTMLGQALSITIGFHMPLYLEEVLGFSAARSGRWLAIVPLVALLVAPLAGRWADRWGNARLVSLGLAIAALGLAVLSRLSVAPAPWVLAGGMAVAGIGLGLYTVPNASAVMGAVPADRLGLAAGLQATMRNLGIAGGAAAAAAIIASRYQAHGGGLMRSTGHEGFSTLAFAQASQDLYVAMAGLAGLAFLVSRRPVRGDARAGLGPDR
jgi:EmrB/QacA subfamily drug resistance transporter